MKTEKETRPALVRPAVIIALGAVSVAVLLLAAPRRNVNGTSANPRAIAADSATVAAAAEGKTEQPRATLKLGTLTEKPEITRSADCPLKDIKVTFKLDPRLTRSLYMGDRWVSPPTFTRTGEGDQCTLEVKAEGVDPQGRVVNVPADWTIADPDMVTVSPALNNAVEITVHRPGQTTLEVASLGLSKKLPLNALAHGKTLVVEVYQR